MKSYLKFLSRNKLYTAIEAVGLAVSLAFVILIGSYVVQQYEVALHLFRMPGCVLWQTLKVAKTNPVVELKKE